MDSAMVAGLRALYPRTVWDLGGLPLRIAHDVLTGLALGCAAFPFIPGGWLTGVSVGELQGERARFWAFSGAGAIRFNRAKFGEGERAEWRRVAAHEFGHQVLEWLLARQNVATRNFLRREWAELERDATDYARGSEQPVVEAFADHVAWVILGRANRSPVTGRVGAFVARQVGS